MTLPSCLNAKGFGIIKKTFVRWFATMSFAETSFFEGSLQAWNPELYRSPLGGCGNSDSADAVAFARQVSPISRDWLPDLRLHFLEKSCGNFVRRIFG
jgi:hypothetical protein